MRTIKVELTVEVPEEVDGQEVTEEMVEEWVAFTTGANGDCSGENALGNHELSSWGVKVEYIDF